MSTITQNRTVVAPPTVAESDLPEGWATGTVCDFIGRNGLFNDGDWIESKDQDPSGDVRLVQLADIGDGYYKNKSRRFLTLAKARELGCTFLKTGDVLIARMPDPLGRACIFPGDPKPAVTAVDVCIVRAGEGSVKNKWIKSWVNTPEIRGKMEELAKGTTRQRISRNNLASIDFPVPPLPEQDRIVAKIDELFNQLDAAADRLARVPKILKRFRQSVLASACSGRLTEDWRKGNPPGDAATKLLVDIIANRKSRIEEAGLGRYKDACEPDTTLFPDIPEEWKLASMDQLACLVTSGSRGWAKYYAESGPLFIRAENINSDWLCLDDVAHVHPPDNAEGRRTRVKQGDILVTITGANVTKSALVEVKPSEAFVSQHVALVRLVEPSLGRYLHLWTVSPAHGRAKLLDDAYGAGKPGLNLDNIKEMAVGLPSIEEQQEIVRRVEALFKLADMIEKRVGGATKQAEKLTQAILAKAFRGELVPTEAELARREGRSYESASALLDRIKSERDKADQATNGKHPRRKATSLLVIKPEANS